MRHLKSALTFGYLFLSSILWREIAEAPSSPRRGFSLTGMVNLNRLILKTSVLLDTPFLVEMRRVFARRRNGQIDENDAFSDRYLRNMFLYSGLLEAWMQRPIKLQLDLHGELPPLPGDKEALQKMIHILLANAAEALNKNGGAITVQTKKVSLPTSRFKRLVCGARLPAGCYVCVKIADDGEGIDHNTLKCIFDPFFSTKGRGRGLGLPQALNIIEAHEGAIRVLSRPRKGSVFTVFLRAN